MHSSASRRSAGRTGLVLTLMASALSLSTPGSASAEPGHIEPGKEGDRGIWLPSSPWDPALVRDFKIGPSGGFRILILSDIQLEANPFKDAKAIKAAKAIIEQARPDLVLTTGDNAGWIFAGNGARKVAKALASSGVPWGVTLGNHDNEGGASREELGSIYEGGRNSIFRRGPSTIHGVGNYGITVSDPSGRPVYAVIMLDSNSMRTYPDGKRNYDIVYPDQLAWYEWFVRGSSAVAFGAYDPDAGKVLPSLMVFHIPPREFEEALAARKRGEIDPALIRGQGNENPCPAPVNSGLFAAALRLRSTTEIVCGHDHVNDWSLPWKGIRLTYGLKTGPGSYSRPDMQGGTLVTIGLKDGEYVAVSESLPLRK